MKFADLICFKEKRKVSGYFQIIVSIMFVVLLWLMFYIITDELDNVYTHKTLYKATCFLPFDSLNIGTLIRGVVIASGVLGVVCIWINRPQITFWSSAVLVFINGLSLLLIYTVPLIREDPRNGVIYGMKTLWGIEYRIVFCFVAVVLLGLCFLATRRTFEEKTVVSETTVISDNIEQSIPKKIEQYKELLDKGILTQEEFDAKKKQLLGL